MFPNGTCSYNIIRSGTPEPVETLARLHYFRKSDCSLHNYLAFEQACLIADPYSTNRVKEYKSFY